jgi:hypothetical protein
MADAEVCTALPPAAAAQPAANAFAANSAALTPGIRPYARCQQEDPLAPRSNLGSASAGSAAWHTWWAASALACCIRQRPSILKYHCKAMVALAKRIHHPSPRDHGASYAPAAATTQPTRAILGRDGRGGPPSLPTNAQRAPRGVQATASRREHVRTASPCLCERQSCNKAAIDLLTSAETAQRTACLPA